MIFCAFSLWNTADLTESNIYCKKHWTNRKFASIMVGIKCVFKEEQTL